MKKNIIIKNICNVGIEMFYKGEMRSCFSLKPGEEINIENIKGGKLEMGLIRYNKGFVGGIPTFNKLIRITEENLTPFTRFEIMEI